MLRTMSHQPLSADDFRFVSALVQQAATRLLDFWPGLGHSLDVTAKGDGTPVTAADLASNAILVEGLTSRFPNDSIISEELPYPDPANLGGRSQWILDPLDGTRSFVAGRDDFSVLVGRVHTGRVVAGWMNFPAQKLSVAGYEGALLLPRGIQLQPAPDDQLRPGRVYTSRLRNFSRPDLMTPKMDSGYAFLKLALGELDGIVIRLDHHREWDIAAPSWFVERAGGQVTDLDGLPLRFGRGPRPGEFCVASLNPARHSQLLELVKESGA
jgi:3'-phosphoadenosine 5'-phosphosulfate (PAPS) 3'-phosphatase